MGRLYFTILKKCRVRRTELLRSFEHFFLLVTWHFEVAQVAHTKKAQNMELEALSKVPEPEPEPEPLPPRKKGEVESETESIANSEHDGMILLSVTTSRPELEPKPQTVSSRKKSLEDIVKDDTSLSAASTTKVRRGQRERSTKHAKATKTISKGSKILSKLRPKTYNQKTRPKSTGSAAATHKYIQDPKRRATKKNRKASGYGARASRRDGSGAAAASKVTKTAPVKRAAATGTGRKKCKR